MGTPRAIANNSNAAESASAISARSPPPRADELSDADLRAGAEALGELVVRTRPTVVAILGITAFRTAFAIRKAVTGRKPSPWPESALFVVPNPSGLNAHESVASLAAAYAHAAAAAGLDVAADVSDDS